MMKLDENNRPGAMISIGHIDLDPKASITYDDESLLILPTRNLVLFPEVTIPIHLVRESAVAIANMAKEKQMAIGIVCQLNPDEDEPTLDSLNKYGVLASVLDVIKLPDGTNTAIVRASSKFKIAGPGKFESSSLINAKIKPIKECMPKEDDTEFNALFKAISDTLETLSNRDGKSPQEMEFFMNLLHYNGTPAERINMIATNMPLDITRKMQMLAMYRIKERAVALYEDLVRHQEMMRITESVSQRARESFDDQQRRIFLQRQMEAIDQELNGDDSEVNSLRQRAASKQLPEKVAAHVEKEINKLDRLSPQTPDFSVQYTYLDILLDLPWGVESALNEDFNSAREILDHDHYGLEKIKERVLEQIAVLMHNPKGNSPILCLVGPPGVGKTSLGQSIADALGRKFQRVSLGGLHDEAEIRGHRRTYIGAMPGRIIEAVRRAGSVNPVLLLDEVDKIGNDYKGDPSSALLEVLDPEQNCRFHDNYIDVDFDLSKVLFIATANTLNGLQQPLIDRMEVIDLSGYLVEEKVEIAVRHLIPKILRELNLPAEELGLTRDAITGVIENYTSESGVRQLEKNLASIARKVILRKISGKEVPAEITRADLKDFLGVEKVNRDKYEGNDYAGVVTGLAWTAVGGEILFIESSLSAGKGEKLTLTGNLGDVMKESAMIALQYIKAHADALGIDPSLFEKYNLHIHVPEGAIPKDGPSAGITMATSIASAFTQRKVREKLAMTGEITLRGKVLPVGGIKEKMLAAKRAGITDIILSRDNRPNVEDIEEKYREGLTFHYVDNVCQVLDLALTPDLASDARTL